MGLVSKQPHPARVRVRSGVRVLLSIPLRGATDPSNDQQKEIQMEPVDDEITELLDMQVAKVSGVTDPASGAPFLLMKSAAEPVEHHTYTLDEAVDKAVELSAHGKDVQFVFHPAEGVTKENLAAGMASLQEKLKKHGLEGDLVKKHTKEKAKAAALAAMKGTKPPGTVGTSDPELGENESDEMLRIICKSAESDNPQIQAAVKVVNDPTSSDEAKRVAYTLLKNANNGGDVEPALPVAHAANDVGSVGGTVSAEYLTKCERAVEEAPDSVAKEQAGLELTRARLRALHERTSGNSSHVVKSVDTSNDPPHIARLRELVKHPDLDAVTKSAAKEVLTRHDLRKSAAEQQEATNRLVAETQARIQANPQSASGGASGGANIPVSDDPRFQISALTPAARLADEGKPEPEPAPHVTEQNEDPLVKEQRGREETHANLLALHAVAPDNSVPYARNGN